MAEPVKTRVADISVTVCLEIKEPTVMEAGFTTDNISPLVFLFVWFYVLMGMISIDR